MDLIANFEGRFVLGVAAMDTTHREFVDLVNRLGTCDGDRFVDSFPALVSHTRAHFAAEEGMMETSGFPAIAEHRSEHARVLGDLEHLSTQLARGRIQLARAYVCEQLPDWFTLHAETMDSALAAHLNLETAVDRFVVE